MLLGGGGLFGTVDGDVPVGVVPGTQGVATVVEVPLGCDEDATVELELLPLVEGVLAVVEGLVPVAVPLVEGVLPVAVPPLLDGVQGTVVRLPADGVVLWVVLGILPVTVPLLPDVPDVPCVVEEPPIELGAGCDVGRVPVEPVVVPVCVEVVPGWVVVVVPG
jgi:hypothetical protein